MYVERSAKIVRLIDGSLYFASLSRLKSKPEKYHFHSVPKRKNFVTMTTSGTGVPKLLAEAKEGRDGYRNKTANHSL